MQVKVVENENQTSCKISDKKLIETFISQVNYLNLHVELSNFQDFQQLEIILCDFLLMCLNQTRIWRDFFENKNQNELFCRNFCNKVKCQRNLNFKSSFVFVTKIQSHPVENSNKFHSKQHNDDCEYENKQICNVKSQIH